MILLKLGGNDLANPAFLADLGAWLARHRAPTVIVHGGGQAIADLQTRLGLAPRKHNGERITDPASLDVAEMVLSGHANKRIVAALLSAGVDALGLSGVDGGLLRAARKQHPTVDLGRVGEIHTVRTSLIHGLLAQGLVPVISPISLGDDGAAFNVNADHAASAVAAALGVSVIHFVSNVPGVLHNDAILPRLTPPDVHRLIDQGIIHGGMIPKVHAALAAVHAGVPEARIGNLAGLPHGGTAFVAA